MRRIVPSILVVILIMGCQDATITPLTLHRGDTPSLMFQYPIASVRLVDRGHFDIYHGSDVRSGSYIAGASPGDMSSGHWEGGIRWVADTLFEARFSKWTYLLNNEHCEVSPPLTRSSTSPSTTFVVNGCPATIAQVHYSVRKAFVRPASDPAPSYPSTPSHVATIYGPTTVRPSANCYWYVSSNVTGNAVAYQWLVDDDIVGSSQDLWHTAGSSTFRLTATASNEQGHWASVTVDVTVDSNTEMCYVE